MNAAPPDTFLGRCKRCKTPHRVHAPIIEQRTLSLGYGRKETRTSRELPDGTRIEGYDHFFTHCTHCPPNPDRIPRVEMRRLIGRHSAKHQCGARCLSATGHVCECSCAGKNHGGNHAPH